MFGLDVTSRGTEIRRRLGYIPAEVGFYDGMTGEAMLRFAARMHRVEPAWGRGSGRTHGPGPAAQGGRALHRQPQEAGHRAGAAAPPRSWSILDEPSAGLDPLMQGVLFDVLREEHRRGATIFFSSHVLDEVQRMCRRVAIVRNGRIVEVAEIETLRQRHLKRVRAVFPGDPPAHGRSRSRASRTSRWRTTAPGSTSPGRHDALLAAAGQTHRVVDVTIEDPTLDDVFLHYYGSDTEDGDAEEAPS